MSMHGRPAARRARILTVPLLTAAAAAPLLMAGATQAPAAASATRPAVAAGLAPAGTLAGRGVLDNVVALTARNAWAVGHYGNVVRPRALIEHWNGTEWHRVPLSPAGGWLDSVAATSTTDVWAVGYAGGKPLVLHFDGRAWQRVANPAVPRGVLADITAISPGDMWAVGEADTRMLIEHWNGASWTRVSSPSPKTLAGLSGVSATSANDVWAVGFSGVGGTVILHWNGTAWTRVPSPGGHSMLNRVAAISASDAWATGSTGRGILILHWNGNAWHRVPGPAAGRAAALVGVSGTSARNAWAVGATSNVIGGAAHTTGWAAIAGRRQVAPAVRQAPANEPLILHWNGTSWRRVHVPLPRRGGQLVGVFAASDRSALAVGCTRFFAEPTARPLSLRWNGAAWR